MDWSNGYIINPDPFRNELLYMSPFLPGDQYKNREIWKSFTPDNLPYLFLEERKMYVAPSGSSALGTVLETMNLTRDDEIWIITTSGNRYISSCVTRVIEKYCHWSRKKSDRTSVILVNHEFGFMYKNIEELSAYNLPIIEDCAYSMFSSYNGKMAGSFGDFAIYSMAKMFPVQGGGLIYSKDDIDFKVKIDESLQYYKACFNHFYKQKNRIIKERLKIFELMREQLMIFGFQPRFELGQGDIPGAFIFKAPSWPLDKLKVFLQKQGIECSVFYGEEAFYLPCHQAMTIEHIDYLLNLIKYFKK